jgi:hyperosmotically inducible periplasmic protein
MKKTAFPERLAAPLAALLVLGLAACNDRPPDVVASGPAEEPHKATSPKGAVAGTAEEKLLPKNAAAKSAASANQVLTERVKAALGADMTLQAKNIDVVAMDGAVTIVGTTGNTADRDKASRIALSVQGVNSVENRMVVVRDS